MDKLLLKQTTEGQLIVNFLVNTDKTPATSQSVAALRARIELLENYWGKVLNRHGELNPTAEQRGEEPYWVNDQFSIYEDKYIQHKAVLSQRLAALQPQPLQGNNSSPAQPGAAGHVPLSPLPKLPLPTFNGEQLAWGTFKERFTAMVVDVSSYSKVTKLQYLQSCLEGPAAKRLNNLEVTGANFDVAWSGLVKRYDNPRVMLSAHLSKVLKLSTAPQKSAVGLTSLLDDIEESLRALRTLGRPVDQWDDWLIEIVSSRLDSSIREDWEKSLEGKADFPTYEQLVAFLENRARSLETAQGGYSATNHASAPKRLPARGSRTVNAYHSSSSSISGNLQNRRSKGGCSLCKGEHFLAYCPSFMKLDVRRKRDHVTAGNLCFNCLSKKHIAANCTSKNRCSVSGCGAKHHSQLHSERSTEAGRSEELSPSYPTSLSTSTHSTQVSVTDQPKAVSQAVNKVTLMPTAWIILESFTGTSLRVRALIDQASEGSFISERVAQALSLHRRKSVVSVIGVGGQANLTSNYVTEALLRSPRKTNFSLSFSALVLGNLTKLLPKKKCFADSWPHLDGLELADPNFLEPACVDCILGGDVFPRLLLEGVRLGANLRPAAQETVMGWIVTGPAATEEAGANAVTLHSFHTLTSTTSEDLRRFWEIEEVFTEPKLSPEENACEEHFSKTHRRNSEGRYVLRLPFSCTPELGDSKKIAETRFLQTEQRLQAKPEMKLAYSKFIGEMLTLGHMEKVSKEDKSDCSYYLPHHAVFKHDGSGKIRVVFNASQPSSNGRSLNDCLHVGPKLQADIYAILMKWRFFPFVFSTDIIKMFRQFLLDERDRDWLRIVWRDTPQQELTTYRMRTVVYGTACAPYQAIRTLKQLAADVQHSAPRAAQVLEQHFYMDDALAGADTLQEALLIRDELIAVLKSAGMELDKWSANHPTLLKDLPTVSSTVRSLSEDDVVATLGLQWNIAQDSFCYKVTLPPEVSKITKRVILSEIARLFDPLGWLAPVIIIGKILLQRLWITGCDWDQPVPDDILNPWITLRKQLPTLEQLRITRWLGTRSPSKCYLHGFADASTSAYAAAVYIVSEFDDKEPEATLLVAKSKVAPIKTVSVPRLELCGALLLARLLDNILPKLPQPPAGIYCWSDSKVTLAWLNSHPSRWKTFVANRVSEILTTLPAATWAHVRTLENPADLATRGMMPLQLPQQTLWWNGPSWLTASWENWQSADKNYNTTVEEKKECLSFATPLEKPDERPIEAILCRSSTWHKILRVFAFVFRWQANARSLKGTRIAPTLSAGELERARRAIIIAIQGEFFRNETDCLRSRRSLPASSSIARFLPFLDAKGIMRVGGRLQNTFLGENEKHPIVIPGDSHLAELLIRDAHVRTLHGGPQLVSSHLLRTYWIIHARNRIRRLTRQCVRCVRFQGKLQRQQMAPLPASRVTPTRPFATTGLDYAGPFQLRTTKGRGHKSYKGYVAIFICMVTRAVHVEVVSDCSTQSFLAAFRRFTSRRGLCSVIYCDNGTNFQGACAEIQRLFHATSQFSQEVAEAIAAEGVTWKFIPPRAPHFGGIWEAAVKAFKHHLRRVLGDSTLTYEEFSTLAAQIEACLNSRPLCPLSSDPTDVSALTPGHFLVGSAPTALPEPFDPSQPVTGAPRYHLTINMRNHFWKRWQSEVLRQMQQRSKWLTPNDNIQVGDLVLLTDDLQPPTKWPLARVERLHPGDDGLARVLTLRTARTTLRRPLVKVIRLPLEQQLHPTAATRDTATTSTPADASMAGGAGAP